MDQGKLNSHYKRLADSYNQAFTSSTDKDKKGGTREEILVPSVSFLPQVPVPLAQAVSNYRGAKTLIN